MVCATQAAIPITELGTLQIIDINKVLQCNFSLVQLEDTGIYQDICSILLKEYNLKFSDKNQLNIYVYSLFFLRGDWHTHFTVCVFFLSNGKRPKRMQYLNYRSHIPEHYTLTRTTENTKPRC